ncbi:hypothetical protein RF11_04708 [Thelohanellus kitauei]|uniref:Uncharacterized protein n=1 Tax=Thelohanellus kitauei TaxID=669202 RepID=A0A0C2N141_THEKT|nr:hypothetical protein RF11_04708 [Thelohanellus kitauei]
MEWDHAHVSQHHISLTGHSKDPKCLNDFMTIRFSYNYKPEMGIRIRRLVYVFESLTKRRIAGGLLLNEVIKGPKFSIGDITEEYFTEDEHRYTGIRFQIPYLEATFSEEVILC